METIPHWAEDHSIQVAHSKSGVRVVVHPDDNLIHSEGPWPTPELLQKYNAADRFTGRAEDDAVAATAALGHYSAIQSLNSEDAITWSIFGPLVYGSAEQRRSLLNAILESVGAARSDDLPVTWLWRRLPHPEKPTSSGGPEIDFGFLSRSTCILGEAKWNSSMATNQGIAGDRSQLDLRTLYCAGQARKALPTVRQFIVLGVVRSANVFDGGERAPCSDVVIAQLSWASVIRCFPAERRADLERYLNWKERYSSPPVQREQDSAF